jgi:hypothetical protein
LLNEEPLHEQSYLKHLDAAGFSVVNRPSFGNSVADCDWLFCVRRVDAGSNVASKQPPRWWPADRGAALEPHSDQNSHADGDCDCNNGPILGLSANLVLGSQRP